MSEPLEHQRERRTYGTRRDGPDVFAAPGFTLFMRAMWNGRWQDVPLDPDAVDDLILTLHEARDYAVSNRPVRSLSETEEKE